MSTQKKQVKKPAEKNKKSVAQQIFGFVVGFGMMVVLLIGIDVVVTRVEETNSYINYLEVQLAEERAEDMYLDDLIDLYGDNIELETELDWFEEYLDVIEYMYELEAENEYLEERLENAPVVIEYVEVPTIVYEPEIVYVDVPVAVETGYTFEEVSNIIDEFIEFAIEINENPNEYLVVWEDEVLYIYEIDTYGSQQGDLTLIEEYTIYELIELTK